MIHRDTTHIAILSSLALLGPAFGAMDELSIDDLLGIDPHFGELIFNSTNLVTISKEHCRCFIYFLKGF